MKSSFFKYSLIILSVSIAISNLKADTSDNTAKSVSPRIVGGTPAARGAWPFMVGLFSAGSGSLFDRQFCGASLINASWVLTAAHCITEDNGSVSSTSNLVAGMSLLNFNTDTGEIITIKRIIRHPNYDNSTLENDIALLELNSPSTTGTPITLYTGSSDLVGQTSTAIGWGLTSDGGSSSDILRQVDLPVVANSTSGCDVESTKLCAGFSAGGKDACQGDSGGPLVIGTGSNAILIGATSSGDGCALANSFGNWARISSYTSFINSYVPSQPPVSETDGPFGLWNGYLGMINILELQNPTNTAVSAQVNILDSTGTIRSSTLVSVPANDQYDVILNGLTGFGADSFGLVRVSSNVTGRISYYKGSSTGADSYDFSYNVPLRSGISNTSYVSFNTFQPSNNIFDSGNLVANWLSIVNLETTSKSFAVNKYDQAGTLLSSASYTLAGRSRVDVEGGHTNPGPNTVGYLKVIPTDTSALYLSQLIRYGYGSPDFAFAFPLEARPASTGTKFVPLGSGATNQNWIEVVNLGDTSSANELKIYNQNGSLLYDNFIVNAARSQTHFNASSYIPSGTIGLAEISPTESKPFMAQSMIYYRLPSGSIASLAGLQTTSASTNSVRGSYNLYLSMEGYLQIHNPLDTTSIVDVSVISQASSGSSFTETLGARQTKSYFLNDGAYGTISNSYGSVVVAPRSGSSVFGATFRVRREGATPDIQFVNPGVMEVPPT